MAIHSSIFAWEINKINLKIKSFKKSGETALKVSSVRNSKCHKSDFPGGSVVKICLPVQETRIQPLVWEDPTCHGATKCVRHNY